MALLTLRAVSLSYGATPLLDAVGLHVEAGERIALLGRNGAGKSTLLKLLAGELKADQGVVERAQGLRVGTLQQQVPTGVNATAGEVVAGGLGVDMDASTQGEQLVNSVMSRLSLDPDATFGTLSAGNKRRVMLARALAGEPDVLLLDEPTNHLDIESIQWLESFLRRFSGTVLFVSHDRAFVQALSTRIIELDRGQLYDFPGDYARYRERMDHALEAEARHDAALDKKLAKEEAWLRRGMKARRARNMGRVRALDSLRAQRTARRERSGVARMAVQEAQRSGKLVAKLEGVSVRYGDHTVISELSTIVLNGDRVGILGPNGCGKTTLLRTLLGELEPSTGKVQLGTRLELAYFDQLRAQLDPDKTVADSVADGAERVQIGENTRHVLGYLEDFLFPPDRARSPVSSLSGGERNRLLLARLFLRPSNLLVLDEPTNDLDVDTLELLEQKLIDYRGTVLVVSHDRIFLDNVVTSTLAYEGDGRFVEYAGGYSDRLAQLKNTGHKNTGHKKTGHKKTGHKKTGQKNSGHKKTGQKNSGLENAGRDEQPSGGEPADKAKRAKPKTQQARKLSFKEKRELEALPAQLEALEAEQSSLHASMADPDWYRTGGAVVADARDRLSAIEAELQTAYARWEALESIPTE